MYVYERKKVVELHGMVTKSWIGGIGAALPVSRGVVGGEAAHVVHGGHRGGLESRVSGRLRCGVQCWHWWQPVDARVPYT